MIHLSESSEFGNFIVNQTQNGQKVVACLISMANFNKLVYCTYEYIAKQVGISARTVRRTIKDLKDAGLLTIKRRFNTSSILSLSEKFYLPSVQSLCKTVLNIFAIRRVPFLPLAMLLSFSLNLVMATYITYDIGNYTKILSFSPLTLSNYKVFGVDLSLRGRARRKRMSLAEILAVLKKRNSMELTQETIAVIEACKALRKKGATPTDADAWQMYGYGIEVLNAVTSTLKNANPKKPMGYFFYECKNVAQQLGISPRWEITSYCRERSLVILKPEFFAEPVVLDRPTAGNTKPNTVVMQETKERQQRERIESSAATQSFQDRQFKKQEDAFNAMSLEAKIAHTKTQIGFMSQMDTMFKDGSPSDLIDARKGLEDRLSALLAEQSVLAGVPVQPMPDTNDRIVRMPEKKIDDKIWIDRFGKPRTDGKPMQSLGSLLPVVDITKDQTVRPKPPIDILEDYEESSDFTYNQSDVWGDNV